MPAGLAFDSAGNLFIADQDNNLVLKMTPDGTLSVFAGSGTYGAPNPGPATSSSMAYPWGVAVDAADNVYIGDSFNYVVYKVTPDGTLSIFAGTGSLGSPTPGPATSSALGTPDELAFDSSGNLYIADYNNSRVYKVTPDGTLSVFAGSGTYGAPTPGPATSSALKTPCGLAFDSTGNLYISDLDNSLVMKVTPTGTLSIVAGTGVWGTPTEGPATSSMLTGVFGLAVDPFDDLIITDAYSNLVLKVTPGGALSILVGSGASGPPTEGEARSSALSCPMVPVFDPLGDLYISDMLNSVVEKVSIPDTAPSAPRSLVATPLDGSASIAFTPGFNGGAVVSTYQYKIGNSPWVDAGSTSPITVSGLTNYTTASVRVRAVNAAGAGASSDAVSVRPLASGPVLNSATAGPRSRIHVEYSAVTIGGANINGYTATAYLKGTSTAVSTCHTNRTRLSCDISKLAQGVEYDVRVVTYFKFSGSSTVRRTFESNTLTVTTN